MVKAAKLALETVKAKVPLKKAKGKSPPANKATLVTKVKTAQKRVTDVRRRKLNKPILTT